MLAFKLRDQNQAIEITCDDAGIDAHVGALTALQESGSHIHLSAPHHGDDKFATLSSVTPWGDPAITEVIITTGRD